MASLRQERPSGLRRTHQADRNVRPTAQREQRAIDHDMGREIATEQVDGDGSGRPGDR
jgi:hypothetical protein